ncbi:MAG: CpaF family protein [Candidatus Dormibacteria bacterium]
MSLAPPPSTDISDELRQRVRAHLVARLGAGVLDPFSSDPGREASIRREIREALAFEGASPALERQLSDELTGMGPLQPLMDDPEISDILVNRFDEVFVERLGRLERSDARFRDQGHLEQVIQKLVAVVGREINLDKPVVDARLADGSRANAVFAPVGGPTLCIRKFNRLRLDLLPGGDQALTGGDGGRHSDWVTEGGMSESMARFLSALANCRANVIIAGATGSGKSTLLRSFVASMPAEERVITIEDTAELELSNPHWVRLEVVHSGDLAGRSADERRLSVADLVQNALRMRPDRLVVGEIRHSREALYTLEALNTGHDGSVTTIHASGAADALARLELLVARDFTHLQQRELRAHIARVIDVAVFIARSRSGRRAVREIVEVGVDAAGSYSLRPVFSAVPGTDPPRFVATPGYEPGSRLARKLAQSEVAWP